MIKNADVLSQINTPIVLVVTNGFEDRAHIGVERLRSLSLQVKRVVLICYTGEEHAKSYRRVLASCRRLVSNPSDIREVEPVTEAVVRQFLDIDPTVDSVLCDISGLSRLLMLSILTRIWRRGLRLFLLYTEAKEYYPLRKDFEEFLTEPETRDAFTKLAEYEDKDLVYSARCRIDHVEELPGANFPNHPLMLISFLTFKRSRLSSVLNQFETNARILIESVPVRRDLQWRRKALEIINFDLFAENKNNIEQLPSLYWETTYEYLKKLYRENNIGYRFNCLLAPLGGKLQTVGSWYFAVQYPDVKVITSTPFRLFPDKYSIGFTDTYAIAIPQMNSPEHIAPIQEQRCE
jgi:hypothetical protein